MLETINDSCLMKHRNSTGSGFAGYGLVVYPYFYEANYAQLRRWWKKPSIVFFECGIYRHGFASIRSGAAEPVQALTLRKPCFRFVSGRDGKFW